MSYAATFCATAGSTATAGPVSIPHLVMRFPFLRNVNAVQTLPRSVRARGLHDAGRRPPPALFAHCQRSVFHDNA